MNNLKRILSLALASVMVLGMMVTGASAAKFSDSEDITHTAAVDTMAALNIIGGQPDGSFQPNGKVTRAQMAKMITFALNGGKDPQTGMPLTNSFTDTTTHWAKEYIEYCANLGIIGGKGNGIFDPEGNVKANEAAKMILVALGFDAEIFELGGPNWSTNTIRLATTLRVVRSSSDSDKVLNSEPLNLFDELAGVTAETELTRDQAAQLIYNGIQSQTVVMALTGVTSGTQTGILGATEGNKPQYTWALTGPSILEDKFHAEMKEGVMLAAGYDSATKTFTYILDLPTPTKENPDLTTEKTFARVEEDVTDLFMQKTRVIYTTNRDGSLNALSLTPAYHDVVSSGIVGRIQRGSRNSTTGVYYSLDGYRIVGQAAVTALPVYEMLGELYEGENYTNYTGRNVYDSYRLIDNNQDGMLDCIIIMPVAWGTVSYVGGTTVTINGIGSVPKAACYEGIAVGDVAVDTYDGIIKAETRTGSIDGLNVQDSLIRMGNSWIPYTGMTLTNAILDGKDHDVTIVNGYVVAEKLVDDAASHDMVLVINALDASNTTLDGVTTYPARIMNPDGTTKDISVLKDDPTGLIGKWCVATANTTGTAFTLEEIKVTASATTDKTAADVGYLNMKANVNWEYSSATKAGALKAGSTAINLADDAVVLVQYAHKDATTGEAFGDTNTNASAAELKELTKTVTLTGKDVKAWNANFGTGSSTENIAFTKTVGGIEYVTFLYIANKSASLPGAKADSTGYGYVVTAKTDMYCEMVGTRATLVYQIWNGIENVTVHDTVTTEPERGDIVKYDLNADGTVTRAGNTYTAAAITGWNATDGLLNFQRTDGTGEVNALVDNNTVYLYIDSSKVEGVAGGSVVIAGKNDAGAYYANAYIDASANVTTGDDGEEVLPTLNVVIVDVNGSIARAYGVAKKPVTKGTSGQPLALSLADLGLGTISRLGTGVVTGDGSTQVDFNGCEASDVLVVTYGAAESTTNGSQKYTLRVGTTVGGAQVYEETTASAKADGSKNAMWFDITGATNSGTWNLKNASGAKVAMKTDGSVCYTWSIVGEDNVVYASGTFKLTAAEAAATATPPSDEG